MTVKSDSINVEGVKVPAFKPPVTKEGKPAASIQSTATSGVTVQGYSSKKASCREALLLFEKMAKELSPEELERFSQDIIDEIKK